MHLPINERFTSVQKDDLKAALGKVVNEGETRETAAYVIADDLAYPNGRRDSVGASRSEWAVALRQLAEFGPAGRPR